MLGGYGVSDCGLLGENRTRLLGSSSGVGEGVTEVKHESKAVEKVVVKLVKRKCVEGYC